MAPSTLKSQWWNWVARQKTDPHLPVHGLCDSFGTWVYEEYGVKQAQEWLGHGEPATTLRDDVRLTTATRAKAVAGLDEVTQAALEAAQVQGDRADAHMLDYVVDLASRGDEIGSSCPFLAALRADRPYVVRLLTTRSASANDHPASSTRRAVSMQSRRRGRVLWLSGL